MPGRGRSTRSTRWWSRPSDWSHWASPGSSSSACRRRKDARGSGAWDPDGVVQVALRAVRDAVGDELVLMADLCLDEYTDHGHCGVLGPSGEVLNDATLELYQRIAQAQAEAGADVVAPSGMMDGQVARHPRRARRRRPRPGRHPGLRRQVRVGALRAVPRRRRRHDRRRRRPPGLPAGPAQPARGPGRDRPGRGRGCRHGDGQARHDVARRAGRGARHVARAAGRLPRERRVRDGEGRGGGRAGSTGRPWPSSS